MRHIQTIYEDEYLKVSVISRRSRNSRRQHWCRARRMPSGGREATDCHQWCCRSQC